MPDLPATPEALDLSPAFLEIAACPQCHSKFALDYDRGELACSSPDCGLAFPVHDGVPDLRIDAARTPVEESAQPLTGDADDEETVRVHDSAEPDDPPEAPAVSQDADEVQR
jgi:uncharacterized protein YbaR (Trm112 family)